MILIYRISQKNINPENIDYREYRLYYQDGHYFRVISFLFDLDSSLEEYLSLEELVKNYNIKDLTPTTSYPATERLIGHMIKGRFLRQTGINISINISISISSEKKG